MTVIDKAELSSSVSGTLKKALAEGTECSVTITSDNYQDITFKVTAAPEQKLQSAAAESVSEVLAAVEEAVKDAEAGKADAKEQAEPAAEESAPAASEEAAKDAPADSGSEAAAE